MNLIPVAVIVLLILGAGYLMTKGDLNIPFLKNADEIELRRIEGFPTVLPASTQVDKQRWVIKTQAELDDFLKTVDPSGLAKVAESINFDKEYLLAVSNETRPQGGHEIKIRRVYKNSKDNTLRASVHEQRPGDGCILEQYLNTAVDIVAISKNDKEIGFEVIKDIKNCEESRE